MDETQKVLQTLDSIIANLKSMNKFLADEIEKSKAVKLPPTPGKPTLVLIEGGKK